MPQTKRQLPLAARPHSVGVARAWARDLLTDLGREDLVHTAMLGVSELVTNAIIHGHPPISVSMAGDVLHPRIEVHDGGSPTWRPMSLEALQGTDGPATVGRGLALVAMSSERWGTRIDENGARKVVWFEPATELHAHADLSPVLDPAKVADPDLAAANLIPTPRDSLPVRLINLPVRLYAEMRSHHYELRRELNLLVYAHPERYPFAQRVIDAIDEASAQRRPGSGFTRVEKAASHGREAIDLSYSVRSTTPRALIELRDALNECYESANDALLLTLRPVPVVLDFQTWLFREVIEQTSGAEPTPWRGPLTVAQSASRAR